MGPEHLLVILVISDGQNLAPIVREVLEGEGWRVSVLAGRSGNPRSAAAHSGGQVHRCPVGDGRGVGGQRNVLAPAPTGSRMKAD
jgi:hypothetical protein